jgi:hypothetical protein
MGIPRLRLTIRLLMITVAVVGVFLTAARLVYCWRHNQALAAMHASKQVDYVRQAKGAERRQDWCAQQATIANLQSESIRWGRLASSSGATAHYLRQLAADESRSTVTNKPKTTERISYLATASTMEVKGISTGPMGCGP